MNAIEFYSYWVPELRVQDRGVNCSIQRRTVEINGVIPSLTEVTTWQKHLGNLLDIHTHDILIFLMIYCKWDTHRLQAYKNVNEFRLFFSKSQWPGPYFGRSWAWFHLNKSVLRTRHKTNVRPKLSVDPLVRTSVIWRVHLYCVSIEFIIHCRAVE